MKHTAAIRLKSNAQSINELEDYLQKVMYQVNINPSCFPKILISLTEAVNNAIIHGNKNDEQKDVVVMYKSEESGVAFTVRDEGIGFDPKSIPDPTSIEKIECCGGRGVFIMSQLSDRIDFRQNGTEVEMYFDNTNS